MGRDPNGVDDLWGNCAVFDKIAAWGVGCGCFARLGAKTLRVDEGEGITDGTGQWSIRVNDQWRVCFKWVGSNAEDVEIVDYH